MPAIVTELDARTARQWLDAGDALLIDVREPDEHARERIAGSRLMPLSRFDPGAVPPSRRVIMHCQGGVRSSQAAAALAASGREGVASLAGGLKAWRAAGLPTQTNAQAPILPIQRQVHLIVGALLIASTILAATVSPWFLIGTGFFGTGLFVAGVTGFCGMGALLSVMPWNRRGVSVTSVNCGS